MIALPQGTWEALAGLRALVLGDAMLDSYFCGSGQRLCPEAPVPIVDVQQRFDMPGGAANCAANLAALGVKPILLGMTGDDAEGHTLRTLLDHVGVRHGHLLQRPERRTLHKARVLCDEHLLVRFDQGTGLPAGEEAQAELLDRLEWLFPQVDVVLVSDYGYGTLTPAVIELLASLQAADPRVVVVDSKNLAAYSGVALTACKPNYRQAGALLGLPAGRAAARRWDTLWDRGDEILAHTGSRIAAVTLDSEGALIFERGQKPYRTYAQPAPQSRAAGAGDTFLSTFAAALAVRLATPLAAELAAAAAAVVVAKTYTATCSREELQQHVLGHQEPQHRLRYVVSALEECRRNNRRIVLTNGCFDILHRGHITCLAQARRLGDVLVVGVNTDESIRRLKGPGRPVNDLADRMSMLAALASVDYVVPFSEDTPHRLIEAVRPDVFVKGGDYSRATLPEADLVEQLGGTIKIIPFTYDQSTTRIIERICQAYAGPSTASVS